MYCSFPKYPSISKQFEKDSYVLSRSRFLYCHFTHFSLNSLGAEIVLRYVLISKQSEKQFHSRIPEQDDDGDDVGHESEHGDASEEHALVDEAELEPLRNSGGSRNADTLVVDAGYVVFLHSPVTNCFFG